MKGVVFVELIAMAETLVGEDAVDDLLDSLDLESGGAFTSVGNYPCTELMKVVESFSEALDAPVSDLQNKFGHWMFNRFVDGYPGFFIGKETAFEMLESIENEVHVEVRKLYPEVELPSFDTVRSGDSCLKMLYSSERPLIDFCQGMIEACTEHFNEKVVIQRNPMTSPKPFAAEFEIRMSA